ncbi:MAG: bifunctional DNA-formamidopyrimidine glycosylase/DNA-(apurinic or apyrimidinic site) lyase [Deltaproteobacteria bacterium]|nr:bifunctional DNA-formamidopyrimidine glycosylase/DNA-(apurinic or apyrimidinic site) lyase [Deltaproteobacteria bacterium]
MPELPEVETVRRSLEAAVHGARLARIEVRDRGFRHPVPASELAELAGGRIAALRRRGKVLLIDVEHATLEPRTVIVHLGMSGRMLFGAPGDPWATHEHVRFESDERIVRFVDPRRFGSVELTLTRDVERHDRVSYLGPEPLGAEFDGDYLHRITRKRRVAIRNFLLDGHNVAGVGNIYANESCFQAGVRPGRAAGRLSRDESERLAASVKRVLAQAIADGGSTLRDGGYTDSAGNAGWFQTRMSVYDRNGQPCRRCEAPIRHRVLGQRSAFFCPTCQR